MFGIYCLTIAHYFSPYQRSPRYESPNAPRRNPDLSPFARKYGNWHSRRHCTKKIRLSSPFPWHRDPWRCKGIPPLQDFLGWYSGQLPHYSNWYYTNRWSIPKRCRPYRRVRNCWAGTILQVRAYRNRPLRYWSRETRLPKCSLFLPVRIRYRPRSKRIRTGCPGLPAPTPLLWVNVDRPICSRLGHLHRQYGRCLLYTSDAADDLLCVDLGGRRI